MEINFGTSTTNCSVCFDVNGNYGIRNNVMWIHGQYWNGRAYFPNGITAARINNSYYRMNKEVRLPNTLTNLSYGFYLCRQFNHSVNIPDSVRSIGYAFNGCENLNKVVKFPNSLIYAQYAFAGADWFNQKRY